jgi:hypothetical protein
MDTDNTNRDAEPSPASAGSHGDTGIMSWEQADQIMQEQRAEIARLRLTDAERAWISVADRMPPNDEYVACLTMSGRPIAARHDAAGWWTVLCTTPYSLATVTHWMPLPAPPSGSK